MKSIRNIFASLILIGIATGCFSDNGTFPKPEPAFTPKQTYAVPADKLWSATLDALDKNKITTTSADKVSGVIQTDYIGGPGSFMVLISQSTRYKFNITMRSQGEGSNRLNIVCKVESTVAGGGGSTQWNDVTPQNTKLVTSLETWLYEQIEKGL